MASELPDSHPLAGKEVLLDTHEGHLEALSEVLAEADPDEIQGAMLVLTTEEGTDTLPTTAPGVDSRWVSLWMLGAHIHHVADAASRASGQQLSMVEAAQDAIHAVQHHGGDARGE